MCGNDYKSESRGLFEYIGRTGLGPSSLFQLESVEHLNVVRKKVSTAPPLISSLFGLASLVRTVAGSHCGFPIQTNAGVGRIPCESYVNQIPSLFPVENDLKAQFQN
jgi:hypothetical protein